MFFACKSIILDLQENNNCCFNTLEVCINEKKQFFCHGIGNGQRCLIRAWHVHGDHPGVEHIQAGHYFRLRWLVSWACYADCMEKMEHKQPLHINGKTVLTVIVGVVSALALGVGMCFSMVWGKLAAGVVIGLVGIVVLLCLIPLTKGIKD
ncbi:hypothetical protein [Candidatus Allofournierella excrementigallinarum]|uniref:hypothetical protein n=1 Tax=Candidatus Allofournierella excrementigallinarum TaxID=2838592 RepID=UPI00374F3775